MSFSGDKNVTKDRNRSWNVYENGHANGQERSNPDAVTPWKE
jgi:hypothetical protein